MVLPTKIANNFIRLKNVKVRELKWFWHPYIPAGALSMIHGPGGLGKTTITCAIAAAVSNGEALPAQKGQVIPQTVLMLSAEDDLEVILAPKLNDMGANGDKIVFPNHVFVLDKAGVGKVEELMVRTGATLVFIDPIVQYMGGKVDMNRMNEVRSVMTMLSDLARKYNAAIVFVHHDRKSAPGQAGMDQDSAAGSADFRNAVRSSLKVGFYPDGRSVMHHDKSNWAKPGGSLTYVLGDDGFEWGEVVEAEPAVPATGPKSKPRAQAVAFIKAELSSGPVAATEIELRALDEGFNKRTLARAKTGVAESFVKRWDNRPNEWYWRLIGDKRTVGEQVTAAKQSAKGFTAADNQVKEINSGSKIHSVEEWLEAEVPGPAERGGTGDTLDTATAGRPSLRLSEVGGGGSSGRSQSARSTGTVASEFAAEIDRLVAEEEQSRAAK